MNEAHQPRTDTHKIEHYEDEIELIDILRVLWKWKYFIITGTIVFGLSAAIISFKMVKIYSIDMVVRPGILKLGEGGNDIYIDSPQNIKDLIDSGTYNNNILNYLNDTRKGPVPKELYFKVTIPNKSNTVNVRYKTANINQGMIIQNRLSKLLAETYSKKIQYFKNEYDTKQSLLKNEIVSNRNAIQYHKRNVKNIEKRIDDLVHEIELVKKNAIDLVEERNKTVPKNLKENNILSTLVYANSIQQSLQLLNYYQNEIDNYKKNKEDELQKINEKEHSIDKNSIDKKSLQIKKDNIQNIQLIHAPKRSAYPIKPKILLIVSSAIILGLFLTIFVSFLLEYLYKHKKRVHID